MATVLSKNCFLQNIRGPQGNAAFVYRLCQYPRGGAPSLAPAAPFAGANLHRHGPCSFVVRRKQEQAVKRSRSRVAEVGRREAIRRRTAGVGHGRLAVSLVDRLMAGGTCGAWIVGSGRLTCMHGGTMPTQKGAGYHACRGQTSAREAKHQRRPRDWRSRPFGRRPRRCFVSHALAACCRRRLRSLPAAEPKRRPRKPQHFFQRQHQHRPRQRAQESTTGQRQGESPLGAPTTSAASLLSSNIAGGLIQMQSWQDQHMLDATS